MADSAETFATPDRSLLTDVMGRFRTVSLFRETCYGIKDASPIWTLKEVDPQGKLPSLRRLYLSTGDPTEYDFANLCFGSWRHLEHLKSLKWFMDYLGEYRAEMEIMLRSKGIRDLKLQAIGGSTPAAKFLASAEWKGSRRGRPSKEEVEGELKREARLEREIGEDATRVGITLLKNGTNNG